MIVEVHPDQAAEHARTHFPTVEGVDVFTSESEWLAKRTQGIGASESAAILGLNPWKSPLALFTDKLGLGDDPFVETGAIRMGRKLEPVVADIYAEDTQRILEDLGRYTILRRGNLTATLDRVILHEKRGVLEIKTTNSRNADHWADEPPARFQVQVQHQLAVTGAEWGSLAVLIGGQDFKWYDVPRNDDFINLVLLPKVEEFMERLASNDPPPADASESSAKALAKLYASETAGKIITLPAIASTWHNQKIEANERIKEAEALLLEADNHLKELLGDAEVGTLEIGGAYKYRVEPRSGAKCSACKVTMACPACGTEAKGSTPRVLRYVKKV